MSYPVTSFIIQKNRYQWMIAILIVKLQGVCSRNLLLRLLHQNLLRLTVTHTDDVLSLRLLLQYDIDSRLHVVHIHYTVTIHVTFDAADINILRGNVGVQITILAGIYLHSIR